MPACSRSGEPRSALSKSVGARSAVDRPAATSASAPPGAVDAAVALDGHGAQQRTPSPQPRIAVPAPETIILPRRPLDSAPSTNQLGPETVNALTFEADQSTGAGHLFPRPATGRIAVKVFNHLGDGAMKALRV